MDAWQLVPTRLQACVFIENSQRNRRPERYSELVRCEDCESEPETYGAGGFKQLGQVVMFDTMTDESVPRRVSVTN